MKMQFSKELRRINDLPLTSRPIIPGQEIKVYLNNMLSARKIALQPLTNDHELGLLESLLLDLPEVAPSVDCVSVGTLWGAVYSEDGIWYRGVVKRVDEKNKKAEICFIDYGNFDMVDIETGLRYLSDDMFKFPPMVFECQWLHAARTNADMEVAGLMDIDVPITVKIVETKLPPSEVSLGLGTADDGPFVVIINELLQLTTTVNEPLMDPIHGAVPSQSAEAHDVRNDTSCGGSEDSVDYAGQGQEPTLADSTQVEPNDSEAPPAEPVGKKDASTVVNKPDSSSAPLISTPESRTLQEHGNGLSPEIGQLIELKLERFETDLDRLKLLNDEARKPMENYFKTTETLLSMRYSQRIQLEDLLAKMNALETELNDLKGKWDERQATTLIPGLTVSSSSGEGELIGTVLALGNMLKEKDELASKNMEAWAEERRLLQEKSNMLKEENLALRLRIAQL